MQARDLDLSRTYQAERLWEAGQPEARQQLDNHAARVLVARASKRFEVFAPYVEFNPRLKVYTGNYDDETGTMTLTDNPTVGTVLHEFTHHLVEAEPAHGFYFREGMLRVVTWHLGRELAAGLTKHYADQGLDTTEAQHLARLERRAKRKV